MLRNSQGIIKVMQKYLSILLSFLALTTYAQIELPAHSPSDQIIKHEGFALKYNEEHEQADWVAYQLTREEVDGRYKRTDNFRKDSSVKTGSASLDDYRGSGYDRGHLMPAGDAKWSKQAMSDTFYLSNMSPQRAGFNRGIWNNLEEKVRDWAVENDEIYIVVGPVLNQPPIEKIGKSGVSVPSAYYKVILDYKEPGLKAIAFVMPHEGSKDALGTFAVSVDKAEEITGIDFFPDLPDEVENRLEAELDLKKWGIEESRGISFDLDKDKAIVYAIVILSVIVGIGVVVLVVGVRMNKKRK